ncbi:MAG: MotA/TolQ/ExbB proton channel family protein [Candidatus Sericytochromatia bacterium]|nr:MotA/TolQ/ExbB proton channel family protein [Candidatus Sericytochromatia bacterium]
MLEILDTLRLGGWMMFPIVLASIVSLAIIFEVGWLLARSERQRDAWEEGDRAITRKGAPADLFSRTMAWALAHPEASPDARQRFAAGALSAVERRVAWLNVIAAISPLFGLLGTVSGMIQNFAKVAAVRPTDPLNELSRGISEALVATAGGLVVAILAALAHHALQNRLDAFADTLGSTLEGPLPSRQPRQPPAPVTAAEVAERG